MVTDVDLPELLMKDPVSLLIRNKLNALPPEAPIREAISNMRERTLSYTVVCKDEQFLGLINERDLIELASKGQLDVGAPVDSIMRDYPVKAEMDDSISSAVMKMYKTGFKHLPVLDPATKKVVGVVSTYDFVYHLIEYFPETVYNVIPGQEHSTESREGA